MSIIIPRIHDYHIWKNVSDIKQSLSLVGRLKNARRRNKGFKFQDINKGV